MGMVYAVLFFIYGIIFGSFFNVVGLRVPIKESIMSTPSHCIACNRKLKVSDLIPIFSYLFLHGKCRGCGVKISPIYLCIELMTGSLFAFSYVRLGFSAELAVALVFISLLVIITVSDIAYMLIPNKVLFPFAILLFGLRISVPHTPWWDGLLAAAVGFCILLLVSVVSKGGIGGGDIKLFFVIGLVLGTLQTLLALFLSSIIGAVFGIFILKKKGKGRKASIPFGPSIAVAAIIAYFWGDGIVEWYGTLFL